VPEAEWGDFKVILALSHGQSVAGAARILGVDNSTVSRRLAAVEEALGACLILRGGREFSFTVEGKAALTAAEAMQSAVQSASIVIRTAKQNIEGVVRITAVSSFYPFLFPISDVIARQYPALHIEIIHADSIANLTKGEADIAIRMMRPTEPDLVVRKAFDTGWCVYASRTYAETYGLPRTPEELRDHRLILYSEERQHIPGFRWIENYYSGNGNPVRVPNTSFALHNTVVGNGIAALPAYEVTDQFQLIRVFPEPHIIQPGWIVYHESLRDSARIRAVVDALVEYFQSHSSILSGRK
jgi:DNA-binding transcriptional LysR family regulator